MAIETVQKHAQERFMDAYKAWENNPDPNKEKFDITPYTSYTEEGHTVYISGIDKTEGATFYQGAKPTFGTTPSEQFLPWLSSEALRQYRTEHPEIDIGAAGWAGRTMIDQIGRKMYEGQELSSYEKDFFARALQQHTGKPASEITQEEIKSGYQDLVSEEIWNPPIRDTGGEGLGGMMLDAFTPWGETAGTMSKDIWQDPLKNALLPVLGVGGTLATIGWLAAPEAMAAPAGAKAGIGIGTGVGSELVSGQPSFLDPTDPQLTMADSTIPSPQPTIPETVTTIPDFEGGLGEGGGGVGLGPGTINPVTGQPAVTIPDLGDAAEAGGGLGGFIDTGKNIAGTVGDIAEDVGSVQDVIDQGGGGGGIPNWLAMLGLGGLGGLADYFGQKEASEAELQAYREGLAQQQAMHESYTQSLAPESRFTPEQLQAQIQYGNQVIAGQQLPLQAEMQAAIQAANAPSQYQNQINAALTPYQYQGQGQLNTLLNQAISGLPPMETEKLRAAQQAQLNKIQGETLGNIGRQRLAEQTQMQGAMRNLYGSATPGLQAAMQNQINQAYAGQELAARMMPQYEMLQWEAAQAEREREELWKQKEWQAIQEQQRIQNLMTERGYGAAQQQQSLANLMAERGYGTALAQQNLQNIMGLSALQSGQQQQNLQNLMQYAQAPLGNLPQGYTEPLYPPTDYSQANMWGTLGNMFTTGLMGYMMNNTNPYAM